MEEKTITDRRGTTRKLQRLEKVEITITPNITSPNAATITFDSHPKMDEERVADPACPVCKAVGTILKALRGEGKMTDETGH